MFKAMSLNTKMMLAPVTLIGVIMLVGWIGYMSLNNTVDTFGHLSDDSIPNMKVASDMAISYRNIRIAVRTLGITGLGKAEAEQAVKETVEAIGAFEKADKEYQALGIYGQEKVLYDRLDTAWKEFKEVGGRILALQATGKAEDMEKVVHIFLNDCPAKAKVFNVAMAELMDFHKANAAQWTNDARVTAASATKYLFFAIGFGILMGIALAIFTIKSVSGLIGSISAVAAELATGAQKVSTISVDVSDASEKLSSSAAQQAAALQETTAAVEQTSAMVRKNAENAQRSTEASRSSQDNAVKGKKVVGEMITSIEEIASSNQAIMQQIEQSNKEMSDIVGVINEIGNKTKVINDIVFQTKLLSFNASVEAARAGEHGKGFAVVAEEVGNLAAMSGRSAKEITDLLETSTKRVQEIVASTQEKVETLIAKGTERVNAGISTAKNCDMVLDEIVTNVESVSTMVTEIATASQEQSKGIGEINKAITELESAAQQNSATSHSAAASADELKGQVNQLHGSVNGLNALIKGGKPVAGAPPAAQPSAKVIAFQAPKAAPAPAKWKKAVGDTPSANDPGFSEV